MKKPTSKKRGKRAPKADAELEAMGARFLAATKALQGELAAAMERLAKATKLPEFPRPQFREPDWSMPPELQARIETLGRDDDAGSPPPTRAQQIIANMQQAYDKLLSKNPRKPPSKGAVQRETGHAKDTVRKYWPKLRTKTD